MHRRNVRTSSFDGASSIPLGGPPPMATAPKSQSSSSSPSAGTTIITTRRGGTRRRGRNNNNNNGPKLKAGLLVTLLANFLVMSIVCLFIWWFRKAGVVIPNMQASAPIKMDPRIQYFMELYRKVRKIALDHHEEIEQGEIETTWPLSYMYHENDLDDFHPSAMSPHHRRSPQSLLEDYTFESTNDNEEEEENNNNNQFDDYNRDETTSHKTFKNTTACQVTVLFMDPRLGDPQYGPGESAWFALESAAAFLPSSTTCVTLLTSSCVMDEFLSNLAAQEGNQDMEIPLVDTAVRDKVYAASLPLFRQLIQLGRVRLSFLDHAKYHLHSCEDYGNPTPALINHDFWQDEFVQRDADAVLLLQDDAVLCHNNNNNNLGPAALYGNFSFVGAVWPRTATRLAPNPPEGMCWGMPSLWKLLTLHMKPADYEKLNLDPQQQQHFSFGQFCQSGVAPVGNGGFSWRSRRWMQRAIATCPHVKWSNVADAESSPCRALDEINEDYYFGTVLRGLGAPLPLAETAARFAVESMFPEQVVAMYGTAEDETNQDRMAKQHPVPKVTLRNGQTYTVPFGFHKPWWYHSNEILLSKPMLQACPYLPFIFTPEMTRWESEQDEQTN